MKPTPELTAYNLGVARAVKTNRADRLAADGICVSCEQRQRKGPNRLCGTCLATRSLLVNAAANQRARDRKKQA